jgi:hypothetical protein
MNRGGNSGVGSSNFFRIVSIVEINYRLLVCPFSFTVPLLIPISFHMIPAHDFHDSNTCAT